MGERGRRESEVREYEAWERRQTGKGGRVRWENKIPSTVFFHSFIRNIFIICLAPGVMLVWSIR